ncbi:MAG: hypothetical protein AAGG38_10935 [Planctomycetota bacterium]
MKPHRTISGPRTPAPVLLLLSIGLASAFPAAARDATVTTHAGETYTGEFVRQTASVVVLNVSGIEATFPQDDIASIELMDTAQEVYDRERAALEDDDLAGRLALADTMAEMEELPLARAELVALQRDFPESDPVRERLNRVEAQIRLQEAHLAADAAPRPGRAEDRPDRPGRPERVGASDELPFLTAEQLRLLRVYEVDLDTEPRVVIPPKTLQQFYQLYAQHPRVPAGKRERAEFRRLPGHEKLAVFFLVRARDLYDQITVSPEPEPLALFRNDINPRYVARYFAPTFGQGAVPGLTLFNRRPDFEPEAYTNFFLLTQFKVDGNPMINRSSPELSLLLQWGLPRDAARFPAPELDQWSPSFRSTQDPQFQRYARWIASLYPDELDYDITYPTPAPGTPAPGSSAPGSSAPGSSAPGSSADNNPGGP